MNAHPVSVLLQDDATNSRKIGIHLYAIRIGLRVQAGEPGQQQYEYVLSLGGSLGVATDVWISAFSMSIQWSNCLRESQVTPTIRQSQGMMSSVKPMMLQTLTFAKVVLTAQQVFGDEYAE